MAQSLEWPAIYVGLPYKQNGRDRSGIDCWGLVRLVLEEQKNLILPLWDTVKDFTTAALTIESERLSDEWLPIKMDAIKEFDVCEMRDAYRDYGGHWKMGRVHCGIVAPRNRLLHIRKDSNSICPSIEKVLNRDPLFYRHKDMM